MRKVFLLLSLLVFTATVFAQAPVKKLTEREKKISEINRELESSTVMEVLQKCNNDIMKSIKDKEPLSAMKYSSFAFVIDNRFVKYRWFIADTGLSRKWLKGVWKLLAYMSKTKSYIKSERLSGHSQTAKYKKAIEYFNLAYSRFVKLIKKPVKVSSKSVRKAKLGKARWQRTMRKKYKIKKNEEF